MVTRDYLLEKGFEVDKCSPSTVEDFMKKVKPQGGYVSVRFKQGKENAVGLYAYSDANHENVRKVVLSDTIVTKSDLEIALKLCRL